MRVLALPGGADPDKFLKEQGAEAYRKLLAQAPPYLDYLIGRARQMDRTTAQGKVAALNFLMPYVQRLPNRLLRSEWATRIASELRVDEPVLREALRRAAAERRSEVKPKAELLDARREAGGAQADAHAGGSRRLPRKARARNCDRAGCIAASKRKKYSRCWSRQRDGEPPDPADAGRSRWMKRTAACCSRFSSSRSRSLSGNRRKAASPSFAAAAWRRN